MIRKFYDCYSSYGHWSRVEDEVKEDKKGKYKIEHTTEEVPCSCHPETCSHLDGKKTISYTEKVYLELY